MKMALNNYKSGKISLIDRIRHMTLPARIASISGAALILAAAGTGTFLLTGQNRHAAPAAASQVSSAASSKPAVIALSLSQTSVSLSTGKTAQITAMLEPASTDEKIVWTSSDEKVATVGSGGLITAVSKGTCTVTALVGSTVSAAVQVTVKDPGDEEIALLKAYLKNGLQAPSPKSMKKLSHGGLDGSDGEVTIKKLNDAAIVDLNGDGHYEMIVEDLFHMIAIRDNQYSDEPFYEIYYVKDGKVVRNPTVIGAENGDSMGRIQSFIAQDSKTKQYYFVVEDGYWLNGDTTVKYQASTLNGVTITPIVTTEADEGHDTSRGNGFLYTLNGYEVNEEECENALKRLVPVHFDLPRNSNQEKGQDYYFLNSTIQSKTFDVDTIQVYKNSAAPKSYVDGVIKQAQERITSEPANLLGMSLNRAKQLFGNYHKIQYHLDSAEDAEEFDHFPYIFGCRLNEKDPTIDVVIIKESGAKFYKNAKIGMTYSQIKSILGDYIGDLEANMVDVDGTGGCEANINHIHYQFKFDGTKDSSRCQNVIIM